MCHFFSNVVNRSHLFLSFFFFTCSASALCCSMKMLWSRDFQNGCRTFRALMTGEGLLNTPTPPPSSTNTSSFSSLSSSCVRCELGCTLDLCAMQTASCLSAAATPSGTPAHRRETNCAARMKRLWWVMEWNAMPAHSSPDGGDREEEEGWRE